MKRKRAFYLVDCLAALTLALLGTAAIACLATKSERFLRIWWERRIALEILGNLSALPTACWEPESERSFDVRGQPVEGSGKFRLVFSGPEEHDTPGLRTYLARVTYRDEEGNDRALEIRRTEWRPGHEGI